MTVWRNATPEEARKRQPRRILRNREYFPPFGTKLTPWEPPSNTASGAERNRPHVSVLLYIVYTSARQKTLFSTLLCKLPADTYTPMSRYRRIPSASPASGREEEAIFRLFCLLHIGKFAREQHEFALGNFAPQLSR